ERSPRVAVRVVHEFLTTEGPEMYGLQGLKKALTARGFDVRDVILKKPDLRAPAAYTYEESRYDGLQVKIATLNSILRAVTRETEAAARRQELLRAGTDEGLARALAYRVARSPVGAVASEEDLAAQFLEQLRDAP